LDELDEPRRVRGGLAGDGELWAMTLDAKRTFDELIERLAPDERTRDEVLANRIYQQLSNAVAGSQEFTAIAKLYELDQEGGFDVLVLDTPPARNALDFLDAPDRLTRFFQGRAIRLLLRPAGFSSRLLGRGTGVVFHVLQRVTGVDLLDDLSVFFRSIAGMVDGFAARAERVGALLEDPATTFVIVTAPRHDPVEEALHFHRKLRDAGMPFGGVVVNRVHMPPETRDGVPPGLAAELGPALAGRVGDAARDLEALARRDRAELERLLGDLGRPPAAVVPELPEDVHDVAGLARVEAHLLGDGR
jgi:anion-transporting  ArsA/GET3 family ATPase